MTSTESSRKFRAANPGYDSAWQKKNSAYYLEANRRRRQELRDALLLALGGKCARCGTRADLTFDHIDPATNTSKQNNIYRYIREAKKGWLQVLCGTHNRSKFNHAS